MNKSLAIQKLMPKVVSNQIRYAVDLVILVAAFILSYLLRFEFNPNLDQIHRCLHQMSYVVLIQFFTLVIFGVYSFIWRYIGLEEVKAFLKAAWWSFLPILLLRLGLPLSYSNWRVPLSIIFFDTILAFGGVLGIRVLRRALFERGERRRRENHRSFETTAKPVLLIGAGRAGVMAVKEILGRGDMNLQPVGFVDDDPEKQGAVIQGIKVLGSTVAIPSLAQEYDVDHVVITIAQASRGDIRRIVEICEKVPLKVRIIPGLYEIIQGNVSFNRIRDVQVEDLLGREPVILDQSLLVDFMRGKNLAVTGAGGSIGSELCRQIARLNPQKLLLIERAEFVLFEIDRELRETFPDLDIVPLVADIGDECRMAAIFELHRPQILFHAAAHKHVPMMEYNAFEALKNNTIATAHLGRLSGEHGVEAFVMISTDKAVRPTSVMGASKRFAELVVQYLDRQFDTKFLAVRFGNVLGSAGSVIPIFREQIKKGGPVTVTHPNMVRYFMTIPEAAQLVLQAGAMGRGSEIFILDMGEPVRILDLARDMITLSGLAVGDDIDIVFTGLRPGEKLAEELQTFEEKVEKTRHPKIYIGKIARYNDEKVERTIDELKQVCLGSNEEALRELLSMLIPEANLRKQTH